MRFPDALVEEWAPILFMALVVRLVNDPSAACRDMYEQALTTLLQVCPQSATCSGCLQKPCPDCSFEEQLPPADPQGIMPVPQRHVP